VFAMSTLRKSGSRRTTRKAWRLSMRFWSEASPNHGMIPLAARRRSCAAFSRT
jgi:hypothetical protein